MRPHLAKQRTGAFTLIELLVVIAVFVIFFGLIDWGVPPSQKRKAQRIACVSNLKEIGMAFRLWEGDHNDKYPMAVSATNGGAMEWVKPGKAHVLWQTVSNQLISPKVLWCPADTKATPATNFSTGFSDANLSYFVDLDAVETYPQMILDGDDNLLVDGKPVQPGILNLRTGTTIAWTKDRHHGAGNIGMADGSAQQVTSEGFQQATKEALSSTLVPSSANNRWLIP
jgi:prepilin-type N-terminal cleavage/methylation domain-containing protein/prepilin-type processing-associated H-X9-DG protein